MREILYIVSTVSISYILYDLYHIFFNWKKLEREEEFRQIMEGDFHEM